ncbi:MAG: transglycosylase SLT domain-containing protein [Alphaproteobacteria bacterium]
MNTTTLYQRLTQGGSDPKSMVTTAGAEFGLTGDQMYQIGMVESGLQSGAQNSKSSATGLYQFTSGTWKETIGKYGAQYGIPEGTPATDAAANSILGAAYLRDNRDDFKNTYGKDPELTDLYMGHFLGRTGRKRFVDGMNGNPDVPAIELVSRKQAIANKEIFFNEDGTPRSASEVYTLFGNKLGVVGNNGESQSLQKDLHVGNVQERELGRLLDQGVDEQATIDSAVADVTGRSLNIPLAGRTAQPFGDTVADYGLNLPQEEERSFMDDTFEAAKAEWRLSGYSVAANEVVLSGLHAASKTFGFDMEWDQEALAVSQAFSDMSPAEMMSYDPRNPFRPTAEMFEKAFEAGIDRSWAKYLGTAMTPDEFIRKVQLASEMQEAKKTRDGVGTGAGLAGAVLAAPLDPLSYVGGAAKGATWGARLLFAGGEAAGMNVLSEKLTEWGTEGAVEADVASAAFGGFIFGATLRGVSDKFLNEGATARMRARQESLAVDAQDMTARPDIEVPEGQRYADIPGEPGAVVDEFGNTHSATSIGNPKLLDAVEEEAIRANKGVDLGPASMLAHSLLRSKHNDVRGVAADLVRSPTGIQGGGTGKTSMTAEDVIGRLEGQDNAWYTKAMKQREALVDTQGVGREALERDIVSAIENGDLSKLPPESKAFAESIVELYTRKFDEAVNPARFGNADAPSVFASRRDPKTYVPQIFEEGKVAIVKERLGGWSGLQKALKDNWLAQWKSDHKGVQARFKEGYEDDIKARIEQGESPDDALENVFQDYLEKKSYGIAKNGEFTHSSSLEDASLDDSLVGIANNSFTKERNVFDSAFESLADDGNPFAVNDLRHFDLMNIAQMYNRRMNGDVAIHASTGKTTQELKDRVIAVQDPKGRRELDQLVRVITGRARADNDNPALNAALRGLQNVAFVSNNAQMWVNNLSEVTGWAANRTNFVLRNGVKGLNQLMNPQTKFTKADMKDFQAALFGNDLNTIMTKSFSNNRDAMLRNGSGKLAANVGAGLDQAGAVLASNEWNPYTKMLNFTQESLTGLARGGVLADITQEAFGGVKFRPEILKNASVTPEQYQGVLDMLRKHVKQVNGEFKPDTNAIVNDPRANDLWRLADYIASDSVTRTNKVGMNYVQQPSALMNLALQFKSFTLKGLNSRTVRLYHESFHGKALDNTVRAAVMFGTMSALWSMQTHYRSLGIPEKDRQAYLDKMLDPAMVSWQALNRSAELGPLLGGVGMALNPIVGGDMFRAGRSTIDPRSVALPKDPLRSEASTLREGGQAVGQAFYDTFPAARTAVGLKQGAGALAGMATAPYGYQRDMEKRSFFEALGSVAPNDPALQWLINQWAESAGAAGKQMQ